MIKTGLFESYLKEVSSKVNHYLEEHLPQPNGYAKKLCESMRYSVFAGGKRIRPALALASFEACQGKGDKIFLATSALELLHTFSLIHDDLPCMDDDDFRRGNPTNHKVFGEAAAVLAGDALCILAFQLLSRTGHPESIETLASALGIDGMIGGQMEDILAEGQRVSEETVEYIHIHKTARLIEASIAIGAQLAGADKETIDKLSLYGRKIGLAFQIVDDILDVEQTTEALGKDAGSDSDRNKATYPAILGLEESKIRAQKLMDEAILTLHSLNMETKILEEFAKFIVFRVN